MTIFRVVVFLVALGVVAYLFAQLRARRIRERYVWLWLLLLIGLGVLVLFPGLTSDIAVFFGFQLSSNLVLTAAATVTFLITVSLSNAVSQLQMSVRTLTEEVAFLRARLDDADRAKAAEADAAPDQDDPEPH
jgi:hypothetical protein